MNPGIAGLAWITPLGDDLEAVYRAIENGAKPAPQEITNPETGRAHHCLPVPPALVSSLQRQARLRRSSPISYHAVAAALAALADAGLAPTPELAARTAIVL